MEFDIYLQRIKERFGPRAAYSPVDDAHLFYEEEFRWAWAATKLKIFSFLTYRPQALPGSIDGLLHYARQYVQKNRKGLPRGWQNGDLIYCAIAADTITQEALERTMRLPERQFSAFTIPILIDLQRNALYIDRNPIVVGSLYRPFMLEYADRHF